MSDITIFGKNISKNFSQFCFQKAIETIKELGTMKGFERLNEVDPEIAKQFEGYLQKQDRRNNR